LIETAKDLTGEDRERVCHPDRVGAGAGTKDTEPDWTRAGMGAVWQMATVIGVVAGEEGGERGAARSSRLTIAGGVREDNCTE